MTPDLMDEGARRLHKAQASVATFRVKSRLTVRAGGLERSVTMRMNPVAAAAALSYSF